MKATPGRQPPSGRAQRDGFLSDLVLEEGGIRACVRRWREVAFEALLLETVTFVLQKSPTRENIVAWLETNLREENERRKAAKEQK